MASSAFSNILLIPGTSSISHLRENLDAAGLELPSDVIAELNTIAQDSVAALQYPAQAPSEKSDLDLWGSI